MLERIAIALKIDTVKLFSTDMNLPETMKTYRKAAMKDVKELVAEFIEEKLQDLDKGV